MSDILDDIFEWLRQHRGEMEATYMKEERTMAVAVITGSAGLIGAEAARSFAAKGLGHRRHRQ